MYKRMNWNGRRIIKIYLFTTRRSLAAWPWFFSTRRREVGGAPRALSPPWCWGIIPISPRAELGGCPFGAFLIYFFQKSQVGWKGERWCCSDSAPPGWFGVFLGEGGCCSAALVVLTQLLIA